MEERGPAPTIVGMKKRLTAGTLWFIAVWFGYEILWSLLGIPRMVGPMLAFVVSSLVVADPAGLFWPAPAQKATVTRPVAPDRRAVLSD